VHVFKEKNQASPSGGYQPSKGRCQKSSKNRINVGKEVFELLHTGQI
jgi:hypothetical protein